MDDAREIWERIAPWWDEQIGEGNEFQKLLINPSTLRLLGEMKGKNLLEIACGNGNFTRIVGRMGAKVLATDVSNAFLERAKKRTSVNDGEIEYRRLDAMDAASFDSLGEFDGAFCNMAMMDMETIDPLLHGLTKVLKPEARFVFSVSHPCFNSSNAKLMAELVNEDGKLEQIYGVSVTKYRKDMTNLSAGILNQPEPHPLFHRSFESLLGSCFRAGWIVDGLEEPGYPEDGRGGGGGNAFSWKRRPDLSAALVVRLARR